MTWMAGNAIGLYLAGKIYSYGINYMFGLSAIFIFIQIRLAYYLIYLKKTLINIFFIKSINKKYNYMYNAIIVI